MPCKLKRKAPPHQGASPRTAQHAYRPSDCAAQMSGNGPSGKLSLHFIVTLCHTVRPLLTGSTVSTPLSHIEMRCNVSTAFNRHESLTGRLRCGQVVGSALHKLAPALFKPASFAAFRGSDVSYREIVFARWRDFGITVLSVATLAGWALKALLL